VITPDVNVLVYAHREECDRHAEYRRWLEGVIENPEPFAISDLVLSSCLRIITHPRVFTTPTPLETALNYVQIIRSQPNAVLLTPGPRHWDIFIDLCRSAQARGNLTPDAWLAALAIESGAELITTDRDFARFPALKWRHPLGQPPRATEPAPL
jgi:toxin-antitoxin system PIN domain toxin